MRTLLVASSLGCGVLLLGCSGGDKPVTPTKSAPAGVTAHAKPDTKEAAKVENKSVETPVVGENPKEDIPAIAEKEPKEKKSHIVLKPRPPVEPIIVTEDDEPLPTEMPRVVMSAGHEKSCKVKVGDAFPDGELTDLEGQKQKLSALRGAKATVVLVWSEKLLFANEAVADLPSHIVAPFEKDGVKVITVNVGGEAAAVRTAVGKAAAFFPVLLDGQGEYFAQLATQKLPRVYVLDAAGKIVWFDLEYGRTVRREMRQAVRFLLKNAKQL